MIPTMLKFALPAAVIVAVSEISKRSSFLGGLPASPPLTSLPALAWLWRDTHDRAGGTFRETCSAQTRVARPADGETSLRQLRNPVADRPVGGA